MTAISNDHFYRAGHVGILEYNEVTRELERLNIRFLRKQTHANLCSTYEIESKNMTGFFLGEHSGLEIVRSLDLHKRKIGSQLVTLNRGRILAFNPLQSHTEIYEGQLEKRQSIVIHPTTVNSVLEEVGGKAEELHFDSLIPEQHSARLTKAFDDLMSCRAGIPDEYFSSECYSTALVVDLLTERTNTFTDKINKLISHGNFPGHMMRAKKVIAERFDDPSLNLSELSRSTGMSKFHFLRCFKNELGITPADYINHLRINRACSLLTTDNRTIDQSFLEAGFKDKSTFYRQFKKHLEISPAQFKKRIQSSET